MARCKTALALILHLLATIFLCIVVYQFHKCPHGNFSKAAVATDSETCSVIGRNILQQGGSAVDAAIAALLCTSVINPQSVGIGGGSIFTVMDSSGKVKIIDSKETVPSGATSDLLQFLSKPCKEARGSRYIGVPGELRGYEKAHKLYGKLPWADLFKPTIKLAREGFKIPVVQGSSIPTIQNTNKARALRKLFSDEKGNLLRIGDFVKFEKLADTLEIIANNGADSFYTGKIAEDLVRDVQEAGGILTLQDLKMYKVNVSDALIVPFGEYQMYMPPPPAGAVLISFILNIMKEYRYKPEPQSIDEMADFFHLYAEALKFSNRLKLHIRDPHIVPENIEKILTDERFARQIRAKIKPTMTLKSHEYNVPLNLTTSSMDVRRASSYGGTSHVSVLAEDGTAVSVTSSINRVFGSQIYSSRTGIIVNNQLADFCGKVNNVVPGERPPSSMAPSILKSESSLLVIGASGASFITTGIASALINHIWFKKGLKESIDIPVLAVDIEDLVKFEPIWEKNINQFLIGWGQNTTKFQNVVNAVEKTHGCVCAVSDNRKLGKPAGY